MAGYIRARNEVVSESGEVCIIRGQEGVKVPSAGTKLTVSEVEKLTGVTAATLRHYDQIGLLCPERTGNGVANDRKLYGVDDLGRLQTILTLREYQFSLSEIGQILDDDDADIYEIVQEKLIELRRQENKLRDLILFAKFMDVTDTDFLEGLACGPTDIEALADLARIKPFYEKAIQKLVDLDDEEAEVALEALDATIEGFAELDESEAFAGVERLIREFFRWWDELVVPAASIGYLGFWAIFEDHALIPAHVEEVGEEGDASSIQMYAFYVWIRDLMQESGDALAEVARLSDGDIVAALEEARELAREITAALIGPDAAASVCDEECADLAYITLCFMERTLEDDMLPRYLGLEGVLAFDLDDLWKALRTLSVLGSDS